MAKHSHPISTQLMTIVPWIPNLAKLLCATQVLTFYFHCAIFQLNAQIAHGARLSRSLLTENFLLFLSNCHLSLNFTE